MEQKKNTQAVPRIELGIFSLQVRCFTTEPNRLNATFYYPKGVRIDLFLRGLRKGREKRSVRVVLRPGTGWDGSGVEKMGRRMGWDEVWVRGKGGEDGGGGLCLG